MVGRQEWLFRTLRKMCLIFFKVLTIEWAEEKFKILSSQETNQEDLEPLEIALDNIYQCMVSD